jgi:hypothetical protein
MEDLDGTELPLIEIETPVYDIKHRPAFFSHQS